MNEDDHEKSARRQIKIKSVLLPIGPSPLLRDRRPGMLSEGMASVNSEMSEDLEGLNIGVPGGSAL